MQISAGVEKQSDAFDPNERLLTITVAEETSTAIEIRQFPDKSKSSLAHRWAVPLLKGMLTGILTGILTGMTLMMAWFACAHALSKMNFGKARLIIYELVGLVLDPPNVLLKCCVSAFAVLLYNELILMIIVYACFRAVDAIHTVVKSVRKCTQTTIRAAAAASSCSKGGEEVPFGRTVSDAAAGGGGSA